MKPEMMNLFATPVYKSSIGRSFTESEIQFIKNELKDPAFSISNYSSKNKAVLEAEQLKPLREIIQKLWMAILRPCSTAQIRYHCRLLSPG